MVKNTHFLLGNLFVPWQDQRRKNDLYQGINQEKINKLLSRKSIN
jgi:hypothetical protein